MCGFGHQESQLIMALEVRFRGGSRVLKGGVLSVSYSRTECATSRGVRGHPPPEKFLNFDSQRENLV